MKTTTIDPTDNTTPRVRAALERIVDDLTTAITQADPAIRRLAGQLAGWPTAPSTAPAHTPQPHLRTIVGATGAPITTWLCPDRTCTTTGHAPNDVDARVAFLDHWRDDHAPQPATQPERHAAIANDTAHADLDNLDRYIDLLDKTARRVTDMLHTYATTRIGDRPATNAPTAHCPSCLRVGQITPRRAGGRKGDAKTCWWCDRYLRDVNKLRAVHGLDPLDELPIEAVTHHHTRGHGDRRQPTTDAHVTQWAAIANGTPKRANATTKATKRRMGAANATSTCLRCRAQFEGPDAAAVLELLADHETTCTPAVSA